MAKEREQVQQQIRVGMYQHLVKPVNITLKELILVLLDDGAKPMGIIMQEIPAIAKPRKALHSALDNNSSFIASCLFDADVHP